MIPELDAPVSQCGDPAAHCANRKWQCSRSPPVYSGGRVSGLPTVPSMRHPMTFATRYDAVIVGSAHNGLVAATYRANAGQSVLVLERNDWIGGATASQRVFPDHDAY